jgi:hypothetical protein
LRVRDRPLDVSIDLWPWALRALLKGLLAMPEINDFSRRLLADFIAVRLRALRIEKNKLGRATDDRDPAPSPRTEEGPVNMPTNQIHSLESSRRFYL